MDRVDIILRACELRRELAEDPANNAYRMMNHERDGLPGVTLDRYDDYLLAQVFHEELWQDESLRRDLVRAAERIDFPGRALLLKYRGQVEEADVARGRESVLLDGRLENNRIVVRQNNLLCEVDLVSGQNTGLFLDMREVRLRLEEFFSGSLLNLFSYTGMFSVHALTSGARSAVNVDLSRSVLKRAGRNYELNGLDLDDRDFVYGDALNWVDRFDKKKRIFDMVIFDPPTFSRNRNRTFSVRKDYAHALKKIGRVSGKYVFSSVNTFSVRVEEYISWHPDSWEPIFLAHESPDFLPGDNPYLKAGLWKKKE